MKNLFCIVLVVVSTVSSFSLMANFDEQDTSILAAVSEGDKKKIKELLDKGMDVNKGNEFGNTPLHLAIFLRADIKMFEFLIDNGADIDKEHPLLGNTALHLTARRGRNAEMLEFLIDSGADINKLNQAGYAALHIAARYDHAEMVEMLIKKGADVNKKTERFKEKGGCTALHLAVQKCHREIVRLLLDAGADVNVENNNWWYNTPLSLAEYYDHDEIEEMLEEAMEKEASQSFSDEI